MSDDQQTVHELDSGFIRRPDELGTAPRSSKEDMDAALIDLQAGKNAWIQIDLQERIALLDRIRDDLRSVADQWIEVSTKAKETRGNAYAEAQQWAMLAIVFRNVRLLGK